MPFEKGHSVGRRFQPGQSGNPKGKPKGKSFKTRVQEYAEKNISFVDFDKKKITTEAGDALIISMFAKAIYKQDVAAAKLIMECLDGKAPQSAEVTVNTVDVSSKDREALVETLTKRLVNVTPEGKDG